MDGGFHILQEPLPVGVYVRGLGHQRDAADAGGQMLKGNAVFLQAGQDFPAVAHLVVGPLFSTWMAE